MPTFAMPDSCEVEAAHCKEGVLKVQATNDFDKKIVNGQPTQMTISIDDPNDGNFLLEVPMVFSRGRWRYSAPCQDNEGDTLVGRRLSVQTNAGCAYNQRIN